MRRYSAASRSGSYAFETGQRQFPFVVVVAESDAHLVGDGPLLDAADQQVRALFENEPGEFERVGVVEDDGAVPGDLLEVLVVLVGTGLGADHHGLHAEVAERLDQRERLERAAHVNRRLAAGEVFPIGFQLGQQRGDFIGHEPLRPGEDVGVLEEFRDVVERLGHVFDPEIGDADERNSVLLLHHFGQVGHRPRALDDVQFRPVRAPDLRHPAVAGETGGDIDAHAFVVILDDPGFSGEVEFAHDVDAFGGELLAVVPADQLEQRLAGRPVAVLLGALEALGVNGDDRNPGLPRHFGADRFDVVPDQPDDAGAVDERRLRMILGDQLGERRVELLLAAVDHLVLAEVRGEAEPV